MQTTAQSDVGKIRGLLLKHVRDAFIDDGRIDRQWRQLNYYGRPDLGRAIAEYDLFVGLLKDVGAEVTFLPQDESLTMDSLYPRDATIPTDKGVILCNMGKAERRTEPAAVAALLRKVGVPIAGAISGDGRIEGGDVTWLDQRTLAVGRGYRTNAEGIRQFRELLGDGVELVVVLLPHWRGPADVFHLMSTISPVAEDLAVVYSPLLPVPFREYLLGRGISLLTGKPMSKLEEWLTERKVGEVECLVPDMSGIARGKILPATKFIKSVREHSLRLPESIFIQTVTGEYAEDEDDEVMGPQDHDVNLQPDPDTISIVPWYDEPTAQVIVDCFNQDGSPVEIASRYVLKRVLQLYDDRGWKPVIAPELRTSLHHSR